MNFLDFNFNELLGSFLSFALLAFVILNVFNGVIRIFKNFDFDEIKRVFHYHYHYKDRRKK